MRLYCAPSLVFFVSSLTYGHRPCFLMAPRRCLPRWHRTCRHWGDCSTVDETITLKFIKPPWYLHWWPDILAQGLDTGSLLNSVGWGEERWRNPTLSELPIDDSPHSTGGALLSRTDCYQHPAREVGCWERVCVPPPPSQTHQDYEIKRTRRCWSSGISILRHGQSCPWCEPLNSH